ncbi:MAG: virulence factor BrkB family protein [Lysobacteraceae bacterium]
MTLIERLRQRIPEHARERLRAFGLFVWKRFLEDRCFDSAGVLAYATVFALVPLSAAVFGILSAFPVFEAMSERLTRFLFDNFVPAAAQTVETYLLQFADSASRLTSVGAIALLASALLMMKNIEDAFNRIWRVKASRPGMARFLVYWTALTLGPIIAVSTLALTSYVATLPFLGDEATSGFLPRLLKWLPVGIELATFTVAYAIVPNRRVPLRHAFIGGLLATTLFELAKWGFTQYLRQVPSYEQIYGTLAVLPIFLIWLYLSWVVVLLGASIAASLSAFRFQPRSQRIPRGYELYGLLRLLGRLQAAQEQGGALGTQALCQIEPGLSDDLLMHLLESLHAASIVQRNEFGDWLLARDLDQLDLAELYEATGLRIPLGTANLPGISDPLGQRALAVIESLRTPLREAGQASLGTLLRQPLSNPPS